ncbi:MAG: hypothetical protein HY236_08480, partial [Acidobacteria bacterium]|nr:hypothetical protein [Acidobacteriota bacterium]
MSIGSARFFLVCKQVCLLALVALVGCGGPARAPQRCHNLVRNPNWDQNGAEWKLGAAEGAIAQFIHRPADVAGLGVIAVGYARVETEHPVPPTDDDVTPHLWEGTINLVNGYSKNGRDFVSPYARLRFTGREVASGCWKRFVSVVIPARPARLLYPHFAFWGTRLAPGVKIHLAALSLVEAPAQDDGAPEAWAECPALPAPAPTLVSVPRRQWEQDLEPNGVFGDSFGMTVRAIPAEPDWRELQVSWRYQQGWQSADRFLLSVTEDGSDPRLSPTSRVTTILARRGIEQWETSLRVRANARPLAIALAAAAVTAQGLRAQ